MANNTKYIPSGQWTRLGYRDKDWSHAIPTWIAIRQDNSMGLSHIKTPTDLYPRFCPNFTVTLFDQLFMARKKTVNPKNWVTSLVRIGGPHHVNISGDTTHLVA